MSIKKQKNGRYEIECYGEMEEEYIKCLIEGYQ